MSESQDNAVHVVLAAGGTGGHIFPAEALTEELTSRGCKVSLITDTRFTDYSKAGNRGILDEIPIYPIRAGTMGRNLYQRVLGVVNVGMGMAQARSVLKRLQPDAVVGFGGYPSFPTMMAATSRGLPSIIHEQNAVLGKANRVLAGRVTHIATSYPDTALLRAEHAQKVKLVGNPVRAAVRSLHNVPYPDISENSVMRVLVMGGSQGAHVFSDIVPRAVALLPESLQRRLRIDQQARAEDIEAARELYAEINMNPDLSSFFTDVPARLASVHLVIGRSGASTIAELTCAGRPSVLVPYPQATDDHQRANAQAIEDAGGAWLMPQEGFTTEALAARLEAFLTLPASLTKAAANARLVGRPDAARDLADIVLEDVAQYKQGRAVRHAAVSNTLEVPGVMERHAKERVA